MTYFGKMALAGASEGLTNNASVSLRSRVRGCLVGGAVGDALGAPVEFMSIAKIRQRFGADGITFYSPAYGRIGAITDDTQMTLFTAEGLLRAWVRQRERGICGIEGILCHAYLRWLITQGQRPTSMTEEIGTDGWLFGIKALHSRRAPGNTCLAAMLAKTIAHDPNRALNDSKGCGGVMRVAPVGLLAGCNGDDERIFELAANAAAITHGHPSGYLTAGFLAVLIGELVKGALLDDALDNAAGILRRKLNHDQVLCAVDQARALASRGRPSPEILEKLGGGWVAEEALSISICCALSAIDFSDGVRLAVNHSGDSDSTGAITGNILGAMWGEGTVDRVWLDELELVDEILSIADDVASITAGDANSEAMWDRYPGW